MKAGSMSIMQQHQQQLHVYNRCAERNVKPMINKASFSSCRAVWQQQAHCHRPVSSCRYASVNYWQNGHFSWNSCVTARSHDMPQGYENCYPSLYLEKADSMLWNSCFENSFIDNFPSMGQADSAFPPVEPTYHHLDGWGMDSTASNKSVVIESNPNPKQDAWRNTGVRDWDRTDVMFWMMNTCKIKCFSYNKVDHFSVDGPTLLQMTEEDFISRDRECGKLVYDELQHFIAVGNASSSIQSYSQFEGSKLTLLTSPEVKVKKEEPEVQQETSASNPSPVEEFTSNPESSSPPQKPPKRPGPGRPPGIRSKKKPEKKCGRLWEFIRDLLKDRQYCPSLICWEDHDNGVFRFVRSEQVAKLWGTIKENPKMTYEKLSRAMRYYYKSQVLQPVIGRRLVYKFGPTAKNWRTPNPNFRM